ncbi:electron transfer flavoprotein subunit beta/FixA family protein [Candidatus Uhrbacteria bacterium]|nr:electron transfer flavoprotein subunit beta/FixA family protein [Candidatus Uhrbacteria bacterium]
MNIVLCLKQVPDTASRIVVAPGGKDIQRQELSYVVNPYDEYAWEEALRLKAAVGGKVTLLSVGPPKVQDALRTGLAVGADEAIHICDPKLEGADMLATARILAAALKKIPFDVVLCGWKAVDDDQAAVGPMLATLLSIPCATYVTTAEAVSGTALRVSREVDRAEQTLEIATPCVLTQQKGPHEPRYASLAGIMASKKKTITTWTAHDLGVDPAAAAGAANSVQVVRLTPPSERQPGRILQGEPAQVVQELVKLLKTEAKVL